MKDQVIILYKTNSKHLLCMYIFFKLCSKHEYIYAFTYLNKKNHYEYLLYKININICIYVHTFCMFSRTVNDLCNYFKIIIKYYLSYVRPSSVQFLVELDLNFIPNDLRRVIESIIFYYIKIIEISVIEISFFIVVYSPRQLILCFPFAFFYS